MALSGVTHTMMSAEEGVYPITSTGTRLQTIGVVVIDDSSKKIEDSYLLNFVGLQKEVISDAITTEVIKKVNNNLGSLIAKSEVDLNGERAPGNRTEETNMGDLVTDSRG